jgi:hypothetical protein
MCFGEKCRNLVSWKPTEDSDMVFDPEPLDLQLALFSLRVSRTNQGEMYRMSLMFEKGDRTKHDIAPSLGIDRACDDETKRLPRLILARNGRPVKRVIFRYSQRHGHGTQWVDAMRKQVLAEPGTYWQYD